MGLIFRAFRNPTSQQGDFGLGRVLLGLRRRHDLIGLRMGHPLEEERLFRPAGKHGNSSFFALVGCPVTGVKPQIRLPSLRIRAMAVEAILRKKRPHIPVEPEFAVFRPGVNRDQDADQSQRETNAAQYHAWKIPHSGAPAQGTIRGGHHFGFPQKKPRQLGSPHQTGIRKC